MGFKIELEGKTRELDVTSFGNYKYWPHTPETVAKYKDFCEKVSAALNQLPGWKTAAVPSDYQYGTHLSVEKAACTDHQMSWVYTSSQTIFEHMTTKPDAVEKYCVRWLAHEDIWVRVMTSVWVNNFM